MAIDSLRTRIWYDLIHAKHGDEFLVNCLKTEKRRRRRYKMFLLLISTGGIGGWKLWEGVPLVALALVALSQLLTHMENTIIINDDRFSKLSALRMLYYERFSNLEDLWFDMEDDQLSEEEIRQRFSERKKEVSEIERLDNELDIDLDKRKKAKEKASEATKQYLNTYHGQAL